jgi:hypothetical protein
LCARESPLGGQRRGRAGRGGSIRALARGRLVGPHASTPRAARGSDGGWRLAGRGGGRRVGGACAPGPARWGPACLNVYIRERHNCASCPWMDVPHRALSAMFKVLVLIVSPQDEACYAARPASQSKHPWAGSGGLQVTTVDRPSWAADQAGPDDSGRVISPAPEWDAETDVGT